MPDEVRWTEFTGSVQVGDQVDLDLRTRQAALGPIAIRSADGDIVAGILRVGDLDWLAGLVAAHLAPRPDPP